MSARRGFVAYEGRRVLARRYEPAGSVYAGKALPAVAGAHTDAYTGRSKSHSGTRSVIPITVIATFDISLAGRVVVIGVALHDNATAAIRAVAAPVFIADGPDLLY